MKQGSTRPAAGTAPLISCIMPTYNRRAFVPYAIEYFLRQDYPAKELIILDDGTDPIADLVPDHPAVSYYRLPKKITLGAKMNLACNYASGDIIANWDDDDWYAPWRLSYQQAAMQGGISVCGINQLLYLDLSTGAGFQYRYPSEQKVWLLGSSLCFTRASWRKTPFADINVGMDGLFVWGLPESEVRALENRHFAVHMIHGHNVSPKKTSGMFWEPFPVPALRDILAQDWTRYINDGTVQNGERLSPEIQVSFNGSYRPLRNVYACLVHEEPDCIRDLIANLRYHDPHSPVLLYNGGGVPQLLDEWRWQQDSGIYVHDAPRPQTHGYLHGFALDAMSFAARQLQTDLLTIVDSDQLALRSGYVDFLSRYLADKPMTGMLSSSAAPVIRGAGTNAVAERAFDEWELWKPLLEDFPGAGEAAVHWSFWPGTVFTMNACSDLVELFETSPTLQRIMQHTQIWATEEVILPTLTKLLGYEIGENPCCGDFVQYQRQFSAKDLRRAATRDHAYFIHPVLRNFSDPLRRALREQAAGYISKTPEKKSMSAETLSVPDLLTRVRGIKGWLSDTEAGLLIEVLRERLKEHPRSFHILETGSYHGKTTVLFGTVLRSLARGGWSLAAVDPHDGLLGDAEQGLVSYPSSYGDFCRNLKAAGLQDHVDVHRCYAKDLQWSAPLSMLYIDGLHDYGNVQQEFRQFEAHLESNALVGFHDYAAYFPGVQRFVDELLARGKFIELRRAESLIILQRV